MSQIEPASSQKRLKFTEEEIESNRLKHKFIFEKAVVIYSTSKLTIDQFIRCFRVNFNANIQESDFETLYTFSLDKLNDDDDKENDKVNEVENDNDKDDDNDEKTTSLTISNEKREKIIETIRNPDTCSDANFKFWVNTKGFNIVENNLFRTVLRGPKSNKQPINLQVCTKEEFFDSIYRIHSIERGHTGVNKSDALVKERYFGITRDVIRIFNRFCFVCNLTKIKQSQARLKPIRSEHLFERGQLDLVDMSHSPCLHLGILYKWFAHYEDHCGKVHVLISSF
jgi:hypothetical protein